MLNSALGVWNSPNTFDWHPGFLNLSLATYITLEYVVEQMKNCDLNIHTFMHIIFANQQWQISLNV